VWQIGVATHARGRGLGRALLHALLDRLAPTGVRYLEATVTPSNTASLRLFRGVAADAGAACVESLYFPTDQFPAGEVHEEEHLLRIGPVGTPAPNTPDSEGRHTS